MLPMAQTRGFSGYARRNRPRWRLTGLPGPTNIQGRVLVAVQHQSAGGTDVGAHRQAFRYPLRTAAAIGQHATAVLAGVLGRNRDHLTPGACCLGFKDGPKRCPAGIADALGKVSVAHQIADLQIFEIDHVVLPQQRERGDSMIDDHIYDGDYILVCRGTDVRNGAIVVAVDLHGDGERGAATVKRIYFERDQVRLQPANPSMPTRYIPLREWSGEAREWEVHGTVSAVYRPLAVAPATRRC
jgi:hypothetical protein